MVMWRRLVVAVIAVGVSALAVACGSSNDSTAPTTAAATDRSADQSSSVDGLRRVGTGEPAELDDLVVGHGNVLVWFWAPH